MGTINKRMFLNRRNLAILAVIFLVIIVVGSYRYYQSKKRINTPVIPSKTTQNDKAALPSSNSEKQQPSSTPTIINGGTNDSSSNPNLVAPFGSFVSNHKPGNGTPTAEESICNTTAGATCYIQFTKGGVTKKLAAQTVDNSGSTIWSWDVKQAGLTTGSWQITAIASLNGKTQQTTDSVMLEVGL